MDSSGDEKGGNPGKGKMLQMHKRELKELQNKCKIEGKKTGKNKVFAMYYY